MVQHIVMWKLDENLTDAAKDKYAQLITDTINELSEKVPEIKNVKINRNGLKSDHTNYELIMHAEFDSYDDLRAYQRNPEYQKAVGIVRPRTEKRAAIDFEI